ncbi:rhomboid family intramembrane serine protease [Desulfosarcina sp. OttesenSCG-928-A07]|nr:rhomboid family intramembrane serine protease [Desulfosarcina sp. OttesenSCG-928-G17]MDL2329130.1 rhomboid family intramembrane serine protease [Desulfosarcina sp. OttesenSCG-928-A07]
MIPLRDTTPSRQVPVVTYGIIAINVLFFLFQMAQQNPSHFLVLYGLMPARFTDPGIAAYFSHTQQLVSLFSFMFLHGGFLHLLGNMWSLFIFGDNVEDHMGPVRFAAFYLLCGLASGLTHVLLNVHSKIPTIGASGAIAGVMGAYFILHPRSRILTLIPILFIPWFVEIPAFIFMGIWFALQVINAASTPGDTAGIAWWAHIGGFIFGIVFLKLFDKIPSSGLSNPLRNLTRKRKSQRFQVVTPNRGTTGANDTGDLYGALTITPYEALVGARKLVTVPFGVKNRLYTVVVPQGISDGQVLRLRGIGYPRPDGTCGDLMLKIQIQYV